MTIDTAALRKAIGEGLASVQELFALCEELVAARATLANVSQAAHMIEQVGTSEGARECAKRLGEMARETRPWSALATTPPTHACVPRTDLSLVLLVLNESRPYYAPDFQAAGERHDAAIAVLSKAVGK